MRGYENEDATLELRKGLKTLTSVTENM